MWGQSLNDDKTNGEKKGRGAEGPVPRAPATCQLWGYGGSADAQSPLVRHRFLTVSVSRHFTDTASFLWFTESG